MCTAVTDVFISESENYNIINLGVGGGGRDRQTGLSGLRCKAGVGRRDGLEAEPDSIVELMSLRETGWRIPLSFSGIEGGECRLWPGEKAPLSLALCYR